MDWLITQYSACGGEALLSDLGCGTGQNLQHFSQYGRVVGGDCAVAALDFCRKRDLKNVFGCQGEAISLESGSVDVVTALGVLEHIRDDMKAMGGKHTVY